MKSPTGTRSLLDADGSAGGTERLFDLAVGGTPLDVTITNPDLYSP